VAFVVEWLIRTCTLTAECAVPEQTDYALAPKERIIASYRTYLGTAVFTDKRLIVQDLQGSNKKKEIFSMLYRGVDAWTMDNNSDMDFILDFWLSAGYVRVIVKKAVCVADVDRILTDVLLRD
jgi:hypothetical protein